MEITTDRPGPDLAVIGLVGELDGSNFEQVIDAGRAARDAGAERIVLDLSGLTYMGSSGLVAIHSIALLLRGQEQGTVRPDVTADELRVLVVGLSEQLHREGVTDRAVWSRYAGLVSDLLRPTL